MGGPNEVENELNQTPPFPENAADNSRHHSFLQPSRNEASDWRNEQQQPGGIRNHSWRQQHGSRDKNQDPGDDCFEGDCPLASCC